jgi:SsrA-binding protein
MCAKSASNSGSADGRKVVAENRKARHDFHVLETYEAGLELVGTEVKSLRAGGGNIRESYVTVRDGQAFLVNAHIAHYAQGNINNHDPLRDRRLLLHRRELDELHAHVARKGATIVPLTLYFTRGRAKLAIGVAKGKDRGDKRQAIVERDTKRQLERELKMRVR